MLKSKKYSGRIIAIPLTGCYTRSTNTVSDELPWEFILCFSKEYEMLTEKRKGVKCMNERRATKRALLTSITALVMCVVMLAGTTFAWFTDTAKTNVNKIQAGNLDVALEMYDTTQRKWVNAEGETLNWVKAQGGENQAILWEPGAEYKLPDLKVVNKGNLALKYEIAITGAVDADGNDNLDSMKLLNVLKFKSVVDNTTKENVYEQPIATGTLNTNGEGQIIKLSAKMDENAGNDYMNMALSNITVTVKAMQASYEYDSNGKTYDENADMTPDNLDKRISANVTIPVAATGDTVLKNAGETVVLTAPAGSTSATSLTLKVEPKTAVDSNITVNAGQTAQPYEISLVDENNGSVTAGNGKVFNVKLYVGKGLDGNNVEVYHNGVKIAATYDNDGYVTFTTDSFSPFTVVFNTPAAIVGDTYYNTLAEAVAAATDDATITLLRDVTLGDNGLKIGSVSSEQKVLTLDLNGHNISATKAVIGVQNAKLTVTGPGKIYETSPYLGAIYIKGSNNAENKDYTVVNIGAGVELEAWSPIFVTPFKDSGAPYAYGVVVNVDGAKLTGKTDSNGDRGSAIYVNGQIKDQNNAPKLVLNNVTQTAAGTGMYLAGYANTTITGGSITASNTGIEIRAGELTVNGATVVGKGVPTDVTPNGNGSTTDGAGIAVAQHTSKLPIKVTINSGDISGYSALYQSNPQQNDADSVKKVSVAVNGGTFKAINGGTCGVYSENNRVTISGGTFSSDPSGYVANGYEATGGNGVWTVVKSTQTIT